MQILSALDAISPAFSRTKLILFSPFRKGRTWKLAATAYLSVAGGVFLPYFLIGFFFIARVRQTGGSLGATILIAGILVVTLIYLVVFYLCSRLRFAFFDIVLNRGEFVAPAWRKYGPQSFKWTMFKVVLGTVVTAIAAVPLAAWARQMMTVFTTLPTTQGQQLPPEFLAAMFASYAAFFLVYLGLGLFFFLSSLLSDFIVPSLALEDTTLAEAFKRLGKLIRNEPGQFLAYVALKLGLALAGYAAQTIAFYIVMLVIGAVIGIIALLLYFLLHAIGVSTTVLIVLGMMVFVVLYFVMIFYVMFIGIGIIMTFLESYTLYFLGGRYPLLGDLLERSTPPRPVFAPPPGYPAYYTPPPPPQ